MRTWHCPENTTRVNYVSSAFHWGLNSLKTRPFVPLKLMPCTKHTVAISDKMIREWFGSGVIWMHCGSLHCGSLYCTAIHCAAVHCTAMRCTALQCTAVHCTVLRYTALQYTALHFNKLWCSAQRYTACTALRFTAQQLIHYTALR